MDNKETYFGFFSQEQVLNENNFYDLDVSFALANVFSEEVDSQVTNTIPEHSILMTNAYSNNEQVRSAISALIMAGVSMDNAFKLFGSERENEEEIHFFSRGILALQLAKILIYNNCICIKSILNNPEIINKNAYIAVLCALARKKILTQEVFKKLSELSVASQILYEIIIIMCEENFLQDEDSQTLSKIMMNRKLMDFYKELVYLKQNQLLSLELSLETIKGYGGFPKGYTKVLAFLKEEGLLAAENTLAISEEHLNKRKSLCSVIPILSMFKKINFISKNNENSKNNFHILMRFEQFDKAHKFFKRLVSAGAFNQDIFDVSMSNKELFAVLDDISVILSEFGLLTLDNITFLCESSRKNKLLLMYRMLLIFRFKGCEFYTRENFELLLFSKHTYCLSDDIVPLLQGMPPHIFTIRIWEYMVELCKRENPIDQIKQYVNELMKSELKENIQPTTERIVFDKHSVKRPSAFYLSKNGAFFFSSYARADAGTVSVNNSNLVGSDGDGNGRKKRMRLSQLSNDTC